MSAGHARRRGTNRWELRWRAGGRLHTATVTAKSQRDAEKQLAVKIADAERGIVANAPARMLFGDYLDRWLPSHNCKEITRERYETVCRLYLKPRLGHIPLRQISSAHLRGAFQHWRSVGREDGKPLARSSLNSIRLVLGAALSAAVVDDLIAINPLVKLRNRLPTGAPPPAEILPPDEIVRILGIDRDNPHHVCVVLCAAGGLRRAEAAALRWRNVDLQAGEICVCETLNSLKAGLMWSATKTEKQRHLTLPAWAVAELRQLWRTNAELMLALGNKLTPDHTVALWPQDGRPVHPVSFGEWCRKRGFKAHALRHTHASILLQAGMSPTAVADRLGHTVKTLLATYAHVIPNDDQRAAAVLDKAFAR
jgi:integrase